jgi:hypothetical protein
MFLRKCLPRPFEYMEEQKAAHQKSSRPFWFLLNKQKGKLTVVHTHPITGQELKRFKGRDGGSSTDAAVYIGKRQGD